MAYHTHRKYTVVGSSVLCATQFPVGINWELERKMPPLSLKISFMSGMLTMDQLGEQI